MVRVQLKSLFSVAVLGLGLVLAGAAPGLAQSGGQTTVRDGLKEAGWEVLPDFLDAATDNITIKFPQAMGGGRLTFGGTIDAGALREKKFVFETAEGKGVAWDHAFGLPFLFLRDVRVKLEASRGSFAIALDGFAGGALRAGGKPRQVVMNLAIEDKKLKDFTLSLPNTTLHLASLPGVKGLPGARTFAVADPTISAGSVGGKVQFKGDTVDAVVFRDGEDWNMGLRLEKPLPVAALIDQKSGFLQHVGLPRMRVLISEKGLTRRYTDLPLAVQNFFKAVGDLPEGDLELQPGVSVIAQFDPEILPANVKKGLSFLGLGQTLEIDGNVNGMFGGEKSLRLAVAIEMPKNNGFTLFKPHPGVKTEFFISLSAHEEMLGFNTTVALPQGKGRPALLINADFALDERETGMEVLVSGGMQGDWHNAAGIRNFTIENPFISVGVNETAGFDLMIDGTIKVGQETARVTGDIVILPEAAFLPEAMAFAGSLNRLPMSSLAAEALRHARINAGDLARLKAELRDVAFAFMTPGAKLPSDLEDKLHISGAGVAMDGKLFVEGKEIAKAGGFTSDEGVKFDGEITPFRVGPLDLKKAQMSIVATTSALPQLDLKGDIELFRGFEEKYVLVLKPDKFELSMDTKFGGAFDARLTAESDGLHFDPSNDFAFEAALAAKYDDIFKNLIKEALKGFQKSQDDIRSAERKVDDAKRKVDDLNNKIADAKRRAQAAYDKARSGIDSARAKVDSLQRRIDSLKRQIHDKQSAAKHEAKHLRLDKAAKYEAEAGALGTELGGVETAKKSADWALSAAEKTAAVVPSASPEVVGLEASLKTAQLALDAANGVLEGAREADSGVELATKAVFSASNVFHLNALGASGSLEGIVSGGRHGRAPMLIVDVSLEGHRHVYHVGVEAEAKKEFEELTRSIAHDIASQLIKIVKK